MRKMPGFALFKKQVLDRGRNFYRRSPSSTSSSSSSDSRTKVSSHTTEPAHPSKRTPFASHPSREPVPKVPRRSSRRRNTNDFRRSRSERQSNTKHGAPSPSRFQRRSSPKTSSHEPSPARSGETLVNTVAAPERGPSSGFAGSAPFAPDHILVGENPIIVSTHAVSSGGSSEQVNADSQRIRPRRKSDSSVMYGQRQTVEVVPSSRRFSHSHVDWEKFNPVRRVHSMRYQFQLEKARRGKARTLCSPDPALALSSVVTPSPTAATEATKPAMEHVEVLGNSTSRHTSTSTNISPRASISGTETTAPKSDVVFNLSVDTAGSNDEPIERKDSHMPEVVQVKDKATAELQSVTSRSSWLSPPGQTTEGSTTPGKRRSFVKRSLDKLRHRTSVATLSSSSSSNESITPSLFRNKLLRLSTPRNSFGKEAREPEPEPEPEPKLPPGFQSLGYGVAGPSNWVDCAWKEYHQRVSLEQARRAQRQVFLEQRQDEWRTYRQNVESARAESRKSLQSNRSGKQMRDEEERPMRRDLQRMNANGICVTTVTLDDCKF